MELSTDVRFWLPALVPIIFLLVAIIKLRWRIANASIVSMLLALLIAALVYGASLSALLFETGKGVWNAATILLVIWPAIYLYEITCEVKAVEAIREGIQRITKHELLQILILGWVFPSFLQGITGFGVAVAVGAPLLLSIGVTPLYSIVIVLLGHSWGATFGTLALAWEALVQQSGMNANDQLYAATFAAAMIWLFNFLAVIYICWLYGKMRGIKSVWPVVLVLSLVMGGGELWLVTVNPTISCFLPTAIGMGLVFVVSKLPQYKKQWQIADSPIMRLRNETEDSLISSTFGKVNTKNFPANALKTDLNQAMTFNQAFLPYYLLIGITVMCLLVSPIYDILSTWKVAFTFPATETAYGYITKAEPYFSPVQPLTYAGTFLFLAAMGSLWYYEKKLFLPKAAVANIRRRTFDKCKAPTIAITCLIVMAKYMGSSGQIYVLSTAVVQLLDVYYVVVSPLLGMVGSFLTGSNMSSNILFGNLQMLAARALEINPAITGALQTTGGVLGNSFSPGCVIMGIVTTGFSEGEDKILKLMMPFTIGLAIIFGILGFLLLSL